MYYNHLSCVLIIIIEIKGFEKKQSVNGPFALYLISWWEYTSINIILLNPWILCQMKLRAIVRYEASLWLLWITAVNSTRHVIVAGEFILRLSYTVCIQYMQIFGCQMITNCISLFWCLENQINLNHKFEVIKFQ